MSKKTSILMLLSLGDLNHCGLNKREREKKHLSKIQQFVTFPTRRKKKILDHYYSNEQLNLTLENQQLVHFHL